MADRSRQGEGAEKTTRRTDVIYLMNQDPKNDRLPPHSNEAEQGVLGCCLLAPTEALPKVIERFAGMVVFYDVRHQIIFNALEALQRDNRGIDLITLQQWMRDKGHDEEQVGLAYLSELMGCVPSAENLDYYLPILWEKYLARKAIQTGTEIVSKVFDKQGVNEPMVAEIEEAFERFRRVSERHLAITPQHLKRPYDFAEAYFNYLFHHSQTEPGLVLPFGFPMKIRKHELTLLIGENGAGKSSLIGQIAIVLAKQQWETMKDGKLETEPVKVCIASMEMPAHVTLGIMTRQLLGVQKLDETESGMKRAKAALDWLQQRLVIYDFLGITDWRDLLHAFSYAREHMGCTVGTIDSVMRIGIPDDDYAQQGLAAARFAGFTVKSGMHVVIVSHLNKAEGKIKQRARGSMQWSDNANNLVSVERNEVKQAKIEEVKGELEAGLISREEYDNEMGKAALKKEWDTKFVLHKQRWPGSRQNAARYLFFNHPSLQFHEQADDPVFCYLD